MSSWNIIGWVLIAIVLVYIALSLLLALIEHAAWAYLYLKTRKTNVCEGQIWRSRNGDEYYIGKCYAQHVILHTKHPNYRHTFSAQWGESYDEWKQFVRRRRLRLAGHYEVKP